MSAFNLKFKLIVFQRRVQLCMLSNWLWNVNSILVNLFLEDSSQNSVLFRCPVYFLRSQTDAPLLWRASSRLRMMAFLLRIVVFLLRIMPTQGRKLYGPLALLILFEVFWHLILAGDRKIPVQPVLPKTLGLPDFFESMQHLYMR